MNNIDLDKKTIIVKDLLDLEHLAKNFLIDLDKERGRATVVALRGDLGSGKTAFVKECAKLLGISEMITSPTFVIMKKYLLGGDREIGKDFTNLIHIDAYRLASSNDLQAIGWSQLVQDPRNLILLEWPERIEKSEEIGVDDKGGEVLGIGVKVLNIDIEHRDDGSRAFSFRV